MSALAGADVDEDEGGDADSVLGGFVQPERSRHLRLATGLFEVAIPPKRRLPPLAQHRVRVAYRVNNAHAVVRIFRFKDMPLAFPLADDMTPLLTGLGTDVSILSAVLETTEGFGSTATQRVVTNRLQDLWRPGTQTLRFLHTGMPLLRVLSVHL